MRMGALLDRPAAHRRIVLTIRFGAVEYVVGPADVVRVQQVGDVGPGVVRGAIGRSRYPRVWTEGPGEPVRIWAIDGRAARERIGRARAEGRRFRNCVEMLGQAPRRDRLEHLVLKHVILRVEPPVW